VQDAISEPEDGDLMSLKKCLHGLLVTVTSQMYQVIVGHGCRADLGRLSVSVKEMVSAVIACGTLICPTFRKNAVVIVFVGVPLPL
jgi:hypothetical protein